ncbi:hypothetical protein BJ742DRAFT_376379 [Cladochytrium replicatum]|nr:hypothetical protein BJ742DRAFT_376379 [Cladochytrium replicatum]
MNFPAHLLYRIDTDAMIRLAMLEIESGKINRSEFQGLPKQEVFKMEVQEIRDALDKVTRPRATLTPPKLSHKTQPQLARRNHLQRTRERAEVISTARAMRTVKGGGPLTMREWRAAAEIGVVRTATTASSAALSRKNEDWRVVRKVQALLLRREEAEVREMVRGFVGGQRDLDERVKAGIDSVGRGSATDGGKPDGLMRDETWRTAFGVFVGERPKLKVEDTVVDEEEEMWVTIESRIGNTTGWVEDVEVEFDRHDDDAMLKRNPLLEVRARTNVFGRRKEPREKDPAPRERYLNSGQRRKLHRTTFNYDAIETMPEDPPTLQQSDHLNLEVVETTVDFHARTVQSI